MNFLLVVYYALQMSGALALSAQLMRRVLPLPGAPAWMHVLLGAGIFPVVITWGGYAGIFHFHWLIPVFGAACAGYALYGLWKNLPLIRSAVAECMQERQWQAVVFFSLLMVGMFIVSRNCGFFGGINNDNEIHRGIPFTVALAANDFKPAFPLDYSLPLSYSFYLFVWSAFSYASVDGYSWPMLPVLVVEFFLLAHFYIVLAYFLREFIPRPLPQLGIVAGIIFGSGGIGFVEPFMPWSKFPPSAVQIGSLNHWEYQYLIASTFCLAAIMCLRQASMQSSVRYLVTSVLFLALSLTFATLTGAFFIGILAFIGIYLLVAGELRWKTALYAAAPALLVTIFILLPQLFTFIGRDNYLFWHSAPRLWFETQSFVRAHSIDWQHALQKFVGHLGILLTAGVFAMFHYASSDARGNTFRVALLWSFLLMINIGLMFIGALSWDWFWHASVFGLWIMGTLGATWLFWKTLERRHGNLIAMVVFGPLFLFSIYDQMLTNTLRGLRCLTPEPYVAEINRQVDLRTSIVESRMAYSKEGSRQIGMAGRPIVIPGHYEWDLMSVYALPTPHRMKWFDWESRSDPCHRGWFGAGIPGTRMVSVKRTSNPQEVQIEELTCPLDGK